jgi:hypothetical protein
MTTGIVYITYDVKILRRVSLDKKIAVRKKIRT